MERAPGRLTAAHAAPPPSGLRRRLLRIVYEWPIAISLFCEIYRRLSRHSFA